ncbi:MAG: pantoate--beta-alanine ligase [Rhodospirillaceae bacterium TMED8]|nr:pantoate--beta-alanine ligase [Magnetovibrio sp.]OUT51187.1 MAG: pantoate--beta-alanine ligase [Rhodospirillaceae bacterium TMED8]
MKTVRTISELRAHIDGWRAQGLSVGAVPTMGGLHEGHISLVRTAAMHTDRVIGTLFVNPKQFAVNEDFEIYPGNESVDAQKFADAGAALMFAPPMDVMYPPGHSTCVTVEGLSGILEGKFRPHFFSGVATIVTKLLMQILPNIAIFGEKDYQQLCVIRSLVRDLNIPVKIIGGLTVREKDGLALSSRNIYLTDEDRTRAPALFETLKDVALVVENGGDYPEAIQLAIKRLINSDFSEVDYITVCNADTLLPWGESGIESDFGRVLGAARLGKTRLIDNVPVVRAQSF